MQHPCTHVLSPHALTQQFAPCVLGVLLHEWNALPFMLKYASILSIHMPAMPAYACLCLPVCLPYHGLLFILPAVMGQP